VVSVWIDVSIGAASGRKAACGEAKPSGVHEGRDGHMGKGRAKLARYLPPMPMTRAASDSASTLATSTLELGAGAFGEELRVAAAQRLKRFGRRAEGLDGRRHAAVAVTLIADTSKRPCFILTRRAAKLRNHAGQWALPGGRLDEGESAEQAALRELEEEVALQRNDNHVLGLLDDYPTRSGFVITPVVVWGGEDAELRADPGEVAAIYRIPLADLEQPEVPLLHSIPESDRPVIAIPVAGTRVHAPTAAILYQLREVVLRDLDTRVAHFEQPLFAWR